MLAVTVPNTKFVDKQYVITSLIKMTSCQPRNVYSLFLFSGYHYPSLISSLLYTVNFDEHC